MNPEAFLTAAGRSQLLAASGLLPARLDVRCVSEHSLDYEYTLRGSDGAITESGILRVKPTASPLPAVDVRPSPGAMRLGVYDIVGGTMELNLGAPGGSRPS